MRVKKFLLVFLLLCSFGLTLAACDGSGDSSTSISIVASNVEVTVEEAESLDLKTLFTVIENKEEVTVTDEMIDKGNFKAEVGTYNVTLTYKEQTATSKVKVAGENITNEVNISSKSQVVEVATVASLDLKTLFTITENGKTVPVTDAMINKGDFKAEEGEYTITLTYGDYQATATVKVVKAFTTEVEVPKEVEISLTSKDVVLEKTEVTTFDVKTLFTIKEAGETVEVTDAMIDDGGFKAEVDTYSVTLTYKNHTITSTVEVIESHIVTRTIEVQGTNAIVEISNAVNYDMKPLFKIKDNGEDVTVTNGMITSMGGYNASAPEVGEYTIILTYEGHTATSVLKIVNDSQVTIDVNQDLLVVTKGDEDFNYKDIFTLYIGSEKQEQPTNLISGNFNINRVGKYELTASYQRFGKTYTAKATVNVLPEVTINCPLGNHIEDANVYKNNNMFDMNSLFEVFVDGKQIPVTEGMFTTDVQFDLANTALTGNYTAKLSFIVNGVLFEEAVNYVIHQYAATESKTSDSSRSFYVSQLTDETLIKEKLLSDIFSIRINGNSITTSSSPFVFVAKGDTETEIPEGKTKVEYTLTHDIQFGTPGEYPLTLDFTLDDREFSFETVVIIKPDIAVDAVYNSDDLQVFEGCDDFTSFFKVSEYDTETSAVAEVPVSSEMIKASLAEGVYTVTCTYNETSLELKIKANSNELVNNWTSIDKSTVITTNIEATGAAKFGSTSGFVLKDEEGNWVLKTSRTTTSISCKLALDQDVLTITSASEEEDGKRSAAFVKTEDVDSYTITTLTGYLNGNTSLERIGNMQFICLRLTKGEVTVDVIRQYKVTNSEEDYYGWDETYYGIVTYYVNPIVEGKLLEVGTATVTLGENTFTFTFDGSAEALTLKVTQGEETPIEVVSEAGTYTGNYGKLTFDGEGKITVEESDKIVAEHIFGVTYSKLDDNWMIQWEDLEGAEHILVVSLDLDAKTYTEVKVEGIGVYSGGEGNIKFYGANKVTINKTKEYTMQKLDEYYLLYTGTGYQQEFKCYIVKLDVETYTYTVLQDTDELKGKYSVPGSTTSYYIDFFGNGYARVHGVFTTGDVFAKYEVADKVVTFTYNASEDEQFLLKLSLTNGDNYLNVMSYEKVDAAEDGETPSLASSSIKTLVRETLINKRLTITDKEMYVGDEFKVEDIFKLEQMNSDAVETISLNPEWYDLSGLDITKDGIYVVTFYYEDGGYVYEGSCYVTVLPVLYAGREEVGIYYYDLSHYGYLRYVNLRANGTCEYTKGTYSEEKYEGTWKINNDGSIEYSYDIENHPYWTFTARIYGDVLIEGTGYSTILMFKVDADSVRSYSVTKDGTSCYLYEFTSNGLSTYYWVEDNESKGQVSVYTSAPIANDSIITVVQDGDVLLEAKVSLSNYGNSLVLAGSEKGTYTGERGNITLDGFGSAIVGNSIATYKASTTGNIVISLGNEILNITLEEDTYQVLQPDEYIGKYVNGELWVSLDGFGAGQIKQSSYSTYDLTYTVTEENLIQIKWSYSDADFQLINGYLSCSHSGSSYVAEKSTWIKLGTYTGEKGSIELKEEGKATVDGKAATYTTKNSGIVSINVEGGDSFPIQINSSTTYDMVETDGYQGRYEYSDVYWIDLDGLGGGTICFDWYGETKLDITYTFDAESQTFTIVVLYSSYNSPTIKVQLMEDSSLQCIENAQISSHDVLANGAYTKQ